MVVALAAVGVYWFTRDKIPRDAARALEEAEQYELYSILPRQEPAESRPEFHYYPVLGKTSITDRAARERLTETLKTGSKSGDPKACFEPRHGIRVRKGERVTDFVICFECNQVQIWTNDQRSGGFVIGSSPQPVFDEILKAASIPLAPSALESNK